MFSTQWISTAAFLVASIIFSPLPAQAQKRFSNFVNEDDVFLALRDASRRDDAAKSAELAARIPNYAIPSYVDYYRLKPRLKSASASEIRDYLKRYEGSAIADRLRNDWLLELGRARDWATFDEQYPLFVLDDDAQLKCYDLLSQSLKNQNVTKDARNLLMSTKDYGEACFSLVTSLAETQQFSANDIWTQIRLAAENNAVGVAKRLAPLVDASETQITQAIERPSAMLARGPGSNRTSHELFIVALGRSANTSPDHAAQILSDAAHKLTPSEQELGWAQIALQASVKLAQEDSINYWRKAGNAPLSLEGLQWKARMALRAGDWIMVKSAIEVMPMILRSDPTWIYWYGRALKAENKLEEAQTFFRAIANQIHFYGQLALEELGEKIAIPVSGSTLTIDEIGNAANNPGLRRALKFFAMNLRFEGVREWNWELRKMNEREHIAAAEFARQNNILDRMVNTSDRTRAEFDFTQRFPSPFRDFMYKATKALGLDMAWAYGLIRQESRFIMNARSHVGASGLMQLMPATAKYVAKKIGMHNFEQDSVNDINTNIQLGTNYLNMVLKDLDGSQAMATAAYNAGPGRPRAWRSTLPRAVEGAIFAESIPFNETRGYVKNVLSNATYYAALFESKPQSLKARLGTVAPKGYVATDLP